LGNRSFEARRADGEVAPEAAVRLTAGLDRPCSERGAVLFSPYRANRTRAKARATPARAQNVGGVHANIHVLSKLDGPGRGRLRTRPNAMRPQRLASTNW